MVDCSSPSSSAHGVSQARILEWVFMSFSMGIFPTQGSNPRLLYWQVFTSGPSGKPYICNIYLSISSYIYSFQILFLYRFLQNIDIIPCAIWYVLVGIYFIYNRYNVYNIIVLYSVYLLIPNSMCF